MLTLAGKRQQCEIMNQPGRRSDALGNVLLGSCHPWGCYFDMYHLAKHCCRPFTPFQFMETFPWIAFPRSQWGNATCHKAKMAQECFGEHNKSCDVDLSSNFPSSQSNWTSVGSARQTGLIHGSPLSQFTRLNLSAANILVADTTAHHRGSSGVHSLMGYFAWTLLSLFILLLFNKTKKLTVCWQVYQYYETSMLISITFCMKMLSWRGLGTQMHVFKVSLVLSISW